MMMMIMMMMMMMMNEGELQMPWNVLDLQFCILVHDDAIV